MTNTETTENKGIIEEMFKAGAHFGYSKSKRHPSMKPLIFGVKNTVEIINLEKTDEYLERAKEFVASVAKEGKQVLFVGSKNEARETVKNAALSVDMPYVTNRWIGGTITNFSEIKKRIARLEDLTSKKEKGELGMYTKKERLLIDREIEDLEKHFGGLLPMKQKPAALFVIDSGAESIAVKEATGTGIPVVSLSGSDCNIKGIDYPVPANDSSRSSIAFFVDAITSAYKDNFQVTQPTSAKPTMATEEAKTKK
jgi:small subunit ribosomal protein S2